MVFGAGLSFCKSNGRWGECFKRNYYYNYDTKDAEIAIGNFFALKDSAVKCAWACRIVVDFRKNVLHVC